MEKTAQAIVERAPVRISFGSAGDTDYYMDIVKTGVGINATIETYAYCELRRRGDSRIVLDSRETGKRLEFDSIEQIRLEDRELNLMKAVAKHFGAKGIEMKTYRGAQ